MESVVIAAPIVPGKREAWIRFAQTMLGPRRADYEAACRAAGIRQEAYWLVETSQATMAIIVAHVADADAWYARIDDAEQPFMRWLGRQLRELLQLDQDAQPQLVASWLDDDEGHPRGQPFTFFATKDDTRKDAAASRKMP